MGKSLFCGIDIIFIFNLHSTFTFIGLYMLYTVFSLLFGDHYDIHVSVIITQKILTCSLLSYLNDFSYKK